MSELTYDLDALADALEASTAFAEWCGEDEDVADHVFQIAGDKTPFPQVVISHGSNWKREVQDLGQGYLTLPQMLLEFVDTCEASDKNAVVIRDIVENVSSVMADLEANTDWCIDAWYPEGDNTPARANVSASTDFVTYRIVLDGNIRDALEVET